MSKVLIENLLPHRQILNPAILQEDGTYKMVSVFLDPVIQPPAGFKTGGKIVIDKCNPDLGDLVDKRNSKRISFTVLES